MLRGGKEKKRKTVKKGVQMKGNKTMGSQAAGIATATATEAAAVTATSVTTRASKNKNKNMYKNTRAIKRATDFSCFQRVARATLALGWPRVSSLLARALVSG